MQRPHNWAECIKILLFSNIKSFFQLSNPDGYLYLIYLKTAAVLFALSKFVFIIIVSCGSLYLLTLYIEQTTTTTEKYYLFPIFMSQIAFIPDTKEKCETVSCVLGITVVIAYLLIWRFSREMATLEF